MNVKSCNVKHNSESVFRYFASAVNSNYSTKCKRKDLYAICSYSSLKKVGYVPCLIYSYWAFEVTLHSSSARPDSPCADSPDQDSGFTWSQQCPQQRGEVYMNFTLWGRDLVSVVRIRESLYYGGVFLNKIYENFVGTLENVRNGEVTVLERCPYGEVRL